MEELVSSWAFGWRRADGIGGPGALGLVTFGGLDDVSVFLALDSMYCESRRLFLERILTG